jgi:hypothetical protein
MKQLSENDSKRVAQAWTEQYGKSLLVEVEAMREQGVSYQTLHADQVVQGVTSRRSGPAKRRRTAMFTALAAAACLVIVAWIAGVPSLVAPPSTSPSDVVNSGDGANSGGATIDSPASPSDETKIPISFDLPAGYRVAGSDYDNGVSLYTLASTRRNDVVLAMYRENEQQTDAAAVAADTAATAEGGASFVPTDEVLIDGTAVPAKVDEAYMLLTFEHGGVQYTLSNRDDMGTLAAFYRAIVRAAP